MKNPAKSKDLNSSTYINLMAKMSYNLEMTAIAELLERLSTACAIRIHRTFIPQIIVTNLVKFIVQNIPHAIFELYNLLYGTGNNLVFLVSFVFSMISMIFSFYGAITAQPIMCDDSLRRRISGTDYKNQLQLNPQKLDKGKKVDVRPKNDEEYNLLELSVKSNESGKSSDKTTARGQDERELDIATNKKEQAKF